MVVSNQFDCNSWKGTAQEQLDAATVSCEVTRAPFDPSSVRVVAAQESGLAAANETASESEKKKAFPLGVVIGVAAGVCAAVCLPLAAFIILRRKKRKVCGGSQGLVALHDSPLVQG